MPTDQAPALQIQATAGQPVHLQSGEFVANAEFHREGADLFLTSPAGEAVVIRDYFAQNPPPDIDTADGAHLSPEMVEAFLPPQHIGEYAANTATANDASPAGQVTEVMGDATIVRADGTRVPAEVGTPVYPGDVVETSADGAVGLLFIDNTTFALSESARLSIDEYIYNSADQSGSSLFSMMQGVFVYTSGMIGKSDPGNVNIETPVGSIGIRGTVVAGDINPAGEDSKITIIDGAIVLTNAGGSMELNDSFETAILSSYQTTPENIGQMSAQTFTQTYDAVSGVAAATFDAVSGGASNGGDAQAPDASAAPTTQVAPEGAVAPVTEEKPATEAVTGEAGTTETAATATTAEATEVPATQEAILPPPPMMISADPIMPPPPPPGGSTFTDATATFGTATGGFLPPPPPPGGTVTFLPPPPPPPPPAGGTGGVIINVAPPPPDVKFIFSGFYTNGTPSTLDDGLQPFAHNWIGSGPIVIGHVNLTNFAAAPFLELSGDLGANAVRYSGGGGLTANTAPFNSNVFSLNTNGDLILNDPFAILGHGITPNSFNFTVKALDAPGGTILDQESFTVFVSPNSLLPATIDNIFIGDRDGTNPDPNSSVAFFDNINGTTGNDLIWGRDGDDTLNGGSSGMDTFIGDGGNDTIIMNSTNFSQFVFADGGMGMDILRLDTPTLHDFTALANDKIKGIDQIWMKFGGTSVTLTLQDIFDMTDPGVIKTLTVIAPVGGGATLNIDTDLMTYNSGLSSGSPSPSVSGMGTVVYDVVNYNGTGSNIRLVIEQGSSTDGVMINNI